MSIWSPLTFIRLITATNWLRGKCLFDVVEFRKEFNLCESKFFWINDALTNGKRILT